MVLHLRSKDKAIKVVIVLLGISTLYITLSFNSFNSQYLTDLTISFVDANDGNGSKDLTEITKNVIETDDDDEFLSPFVAKLIHSTERTTNYSVPISDSQKTCAKDTTSLILDEWKKNHKQLTCNTTTSMLPFTPEQPITVVDEYVLQRWEYQPVVYVYKNTEAWSMSGPRRTGCSPTHDDTTARSLDHLLLSPPKRSMQTQINNGTTNNDDNNIVAAVIDVNATVIRIVPFDSINPYERFHAYLNVAMIMIMFDLQDPQLVFRQATSDHPKGDLDMWRIFSKLEPIIVSNDGESLTESTTRVASASPNTKTRYRFREIIEASSSGTSILVTKSENGNLRGRGIDHHCNSLLVQSIVKWIKRRFDLDRLRPRQEKKRVQSSTDLEGPITNKNTTIIQILWSSRQPYCCVRNKIYTPKRALGDETRWIESLGTRLGPGYNITTVNFGTLSTFDSIRLAAQSDIMVGVHGAGLMWSAFLPVPLPLPLGRHESSNIDRSGGLVEIFGGDRSSGNRHYHNIASLVGIQYRQSSFYPLAWNDDRVNEVATLIRSIDINY